MKIILSLVLIFSCLITRIPAQLSSPSFDNQSAYIGCWIGMRGGKLKITSNKIYDVGSKEKSVYKEKTIAKEEIRGLQTGEEYLLEAVNNFPKSFLAKLIKLSFNNDGTVGITTYNSYNDLLEDKFVGQGLFEKTSCNNLK